MRNLVSAYTHPKQLDWSVFIAHHLAEARAMYAQQKAVPYTHWDTQCFETMRYIRRRIFDHKRNRL